MDSEVKISLANLQEFGNIVTQKIEESKSQPEVYVFDGEDTNANKAMLKEVAWAYGYDNPVILTYHNSPCIYNTVSVSGDKIQLYAYFLFFDGYDINMSMNGTVDNSSTIKTDHGIKYTNWNITRIVYLEASNSFTIQDNYKTFRMLEKDSSFLGLNNATEYTPTADYNPATKKYVDDLIKTIVIPDTSSNGALNIVDGNGTNSLRQISAFSGNRLYNTSGIGQGYEAGESSTALGIGTIAEVEGALAIGKYNQTNGSSGFEDDPEQPYVFMIGAGTGNETNNRSNIHTVGTDGAAWYAKDVYVGGTNLETGKKLVTLDEVNALITSLQTTTASLQQRIEQLEKDSEGGTTLGTPTDEEDKETGGTEIPNPLG